MDLIDRRVARIEGSKSPVAKNHTLGLLTSYEATGALDLRLWED